MVPAELPAAVQMAAGSRCASAVGIVMAAAVVAACTVIPIEPIGSGDLSGRVYVECYGEDRFVDRRTLL